MTGRYEFKHDWRANGRGLKSRTMHKLKRAEVKASDTYRAKRRAFEASFLSMMPVSPAPASAGGEASAVMGATPESSS